VNICEARKEAMAVNKLIVPVKVAPIHRSIEEGLGGSEGWGEREGGEEGRGERKGRRRREGHERKGK
jgi:hypothetical protein